MPNLESRVKNLEKTEKAMNGGKDEKAFFFRENPQVPSEAEEQFLKDNPDFDGELYIYSFGRENLAPSV